MPLAQFFELLHPFNVLHRSHIVIPTLQIIVHHRENNQTPKHQASPIHRNRLWIRHRWKQRKHNRNRKIAKRDTIYEDTRPTEIETGEKEGFPEKPFPKYAADDDDVGAVEADVPEGDEDVECDCRADDDEGKEASGEKREHDCVDRDVATGWYLNTLSASNIAIKG
jgi:hypothetical protein